MNAKTFCVSLVALVVGLLLASQTSDAGVTSTIAREIVEHMPGLPHIPTPGMPDMPDMPSLSMPDMPDMPDMPSLSMPDMLNMPSMSSLFSALKELNYLLTYIPAVNGAEHVIKRVKDLIEIIMKMESMASMVPSIPHVPKVPHIG